MAENFYTILTSIGKSKLANSTVLGNKVNLKTLQVGDGNGTYCEPSEDQTSLVNKVWEGEISSISEDETNSNWIVIQTIIPATDGGFYIREAGIFDEDGDLIAVSKVSETYKPVISEGSSKDVSIKIVLEVSNADNITLNIDPNVVAATKNDIEVLEMKIQSVNTQLSEMDQQQKTYSELAIMVANNKLVAGIQYALTDYATKYQQPDTLTIKTMAVERLILTAISQNKFAPVCYSLDYPKDEIYYDFTFNLCEDKTTSRNGFITRRINQESMIDCSMDWRTILWVRYKPDPNNYYIGTTLTPYFTWTSGVATLNVIYKSGNGLYMAWNNTTIPTSATDSNVFLCIYTDITVALLRNDTKVANDGSKDIKLIKGALVERMTFGANCSRITIPTRYFYSYYNDGRSYYSNNVFGDNCIDITLGRDSYDNTFGSNVVCITGSDGMSTNTIIDNSSYNFWGPVFNGNYLGSSCQFNLFGPNCYGNVLSGSCYSNSFASSCVNNILNVGSSNSSFGAYFNNNIFGPSCGGNTFGANCGNNKFGYSFSINFIGSSFNGNTVGYGCDYNTFGSQVYTNTFGNSFAYNTIGSDFHNNTFGTNCWSNVFGSSCYSNTVGNNFTDNKVGSDCNHMSIENSCCRNDIGETCANLVMGDGCNNNYLGCFCHDNSFGVNCCDNVLGSECCGNIFGSANCGNVFESNCYSNKFYNSNNSFNHLGPNCHDNTFIGNSNGNIFGASCFGNSFADNCTLNMFGSNCNSNTFGANCDDNSIGPNCAGIVFGANSGSNTFSANCYSITLGTSCWSNTFGSSCYQNTFGNTCQNNQLAPATIGNTFGDNKSNLIVSYMRSKNISAVTALANRDYTSYIEKNSNGYIVYSALSSSNVFTYTTIA